MRVVASLPCYSAKNVNQQRGIGVFDRSIAALRTLNEYGFGVEGSGPLCAAAGGKTRPAAVLSSVQQMRWLRISDNLA